MKTNKEILRDYLEISIQVDLVNEVIEEVSAKGRGTICYDAKLARLRASLEEYETKYYWIRFIVKEMDGLLEMKATV